MVSLYFPGLRSLTHEWSLLTIIPLAGW
jgi:hypothetical protein